jgi:hypothetical protein
VQPRDIAASRIGLVCVGALFVAAALGSPASAQDTNYWTDQFGNTELLLSGAVVASVADTSAVYYNPGALALNKERQVLLSANVVDYMIVTGKQALGHGRDFGDTRLRWLPSLVAGELRFRALGRSRLAYAVLVRQSVSTRLEDRREIVPASLPPATVYADSRLDANLSEYWGGLTWAQPVGRKLGLGITAFAAARDQRGRPEATVQTLAGGSAGAIGVLSRDYSFVHGRVFLRMGVNAELGQWELGLTVTTPSLGIWGQGAVSSDSSVVTSGGPGQPGSARITTDNQSGLPAHFQSPLAISAGLTRSFGRMHLGASAEWFDAVGPFQVLRPKSFSSQSTGELVQYDVSYGLRSVLNVAAGVQYDISPSWRAFAGVRSDRSGALERTRSSSTFSTTDLYHLSAGLTLRLGSADLALGFVYARGDGDTPAIVEQLPGVPGVAMPPIKTEWRRYTVLLGLNLPFATSSGP